MRVFDNGMPPGFEAIPMMVSQEYSVRDIVVVSATGDQGAIVSIDADPSSDEGTTIEIRGIPGTFAPSEITLIQRRLV